MTLTMIMNDHGLQPVQNNRIVIIEIEFDKDYYYVLFHCIFGGIIANKYSCRDLHVYFS
jgi:hypothetical protein